MHLQIIISFLLQVKPGVGFIDAFLQNEVMKFSERIEAGARIAELVVLMIADSSEPKNRIWTGILICAITIDGKVSCVSPCICSG